MDERKRTHLQQTHCKVLVFERTLIDGPRVEISHQGLYRWGLEILSLDVFEYAKHM